jgi:hypothetical protein
MKNKILIATFAAILLCAALNFAITMAQDECPTCHGTGEIECSYCDGTGEITAEQGENCEYCSGTGTLEPIVMLKSRSTWLSDGKVNVQVKYTNQEDASTSGKVTAEVEAQGNKYTGTSSETTFPPHEETEVTFTIEGISYADYNYLQEQQFFSTSITLQVDNIVCPHCDGTGLVALSLECPQCGGTGFIECPTCGGSGIAAGTGNENLDIGGAMYGVTAVAVAGVAIGAFVVVKRRGVKEADLRKLTSSEFQSWVLKKMSGKSSSQSEAHMGIDGYTIDGNPILIRQTDDIDRNVIEKFAAAMGRRNAKNGTIIAFNFGTDAVRGRVRAKLNYGREIQMITVRELIEGRNRSL